ncbi:hypothetical protein ACHWGP_28805, partial [Klebsiella pneumoniae]
AAAPTTAANAGTTAARPGATGVNAPAGGVRRDAVPARPQQRDRKGDDRRTSGKLTVNRALGDGDGARARSLAALKRAREKERRGT